jgi:hypothetical protein
LFWGGNGFFDQATYHPGFVKTEVHFHGIVWKSWLVRLIAAIFFPVTGLQPPIISYSQEPNNLLYSLEGAILPLKWDFIPINLDIKRPPIIYIINSVI